MTAAALAEGSNLNRKTKALNKEKIPLYVAKFLNFHGQTHVMLRKHASRWNPFKLSAYSYKAVKFASSGGYFGFIDMEWQDAEDCEWLADYWIYDISVIDSNGLYKRVCHGRLDWIGYSTCRECHNIFKCGAIDCEIMIPDHCPKCMDRNIEDLFRSAVEEYCP